MSSAGAVLALLFVCAALNVGSGSRDCCSNISKKAKDCKEACQKVWMSNGPLQRLENMAFVYAACPSIRNWDQVSSCMNSTYPVIRDIDIWEGRACCELSTAVECRIACMQATNTESLSETCRKSQEQRLFSCFARQEGSSECCRSAPSLPYCRMGCRAMFAHYGPPSPDLGDALLKLCSTADRRLSQCIANHSQDYEVNPTDSLTCCLKSTSIKCRDACSNALMTLKTGQEMIDTLIPECGAPQPLDPMWSCFMLSSYSQHGSESEAGGAPSLASSSSLSDAMDGARLLCCSRAHKLSCRQLCWQMYAGGGGRSISDGKTPAAVWSEFSRQCQYEPGEAELSHCLQEVEEPCSPGCSGMQFCRYFNNRPTDMFRTCTAQADQAARRDYESWLHSRMISFPNGIKIALKDLASCEPDLWKAVACAMQVKPCKRKSHSSRICKSDCLYILNKCVDFTKVPEQTANSLCDHLPVSDKEECIHLNLFTEGHSSSGTKVALSLGISHPCWPNPCNVSQVCEVNREPCASNEDCKPYVCLPACPVSYGGSVGGEPAMLAVKHGYHVTMPDASSARLSWVCHQLCTCQRSGSSSLVGHCTKLDCTAGRPESCYPRDDLLDYLPEGRGIEHGEKVDVGCNECECHSGELTCSRKNCDSATSGQDGANTGFPCRCSNYYSPVCAKNGKTYANKCLAQCVGLPDDYYVAGTCASRNPCKNNPCGAGSKCVQRKHVCLSTDVECQQYECISPPGQCNANMNDPVCDSKGLDFKNLCTLFSSGRQLAYRGRCKSHCEQTGVVCGVNGETYANECAAWAERVLADYYGPCKAIGIHVEDNVPSGSSAMPSRSCKDIMCPGVEIAATCQRIVPPGACCPICGAELRTPYSRRQLKNLAGGSLPTIAVADVASHLRQYVTVAECDVFSYLSFEDEIVLLIVPVVRSPTSLQVEACNAEAEKVSTWIVSRNPMVFIDATLSVLMSSRIRVALMDVPSAGKQQLCCMSSASHLQPGHCTVTMLTTISVMLVVRVVRSLCCWSS